MGSKILKFWLLTVILAGSEALLFQNFVTSSISSVSAKQSSLAVNQKVPDTATSSTPSEEEAGLPARLLIPKIKVNAAIDMVGLLPDGSMGVPRIPRNVAWFKLGTRPGDIGSAVMAGHVNWWNGAASAFARLNQLKPGDKIMVQDDKGVVIPFVVSYIRSFDAAADASEIFGSNDGLSHLNLITCVGAWNKRTRQYNKRLVVFADKETK